MRIRAPAVPLINCTPNFSLWSAADRLFDKDTQHWTGTEMKLKGLLKVDDEVFSFMGKTDFKNMTQTDLDVDIFKSTYTFSCEYADISVKFTTPLLLEDLAIMARPVTYMEISLSKVKKAFKDITITLEASDDFCLREKDKSSTEACTFKIKSYAGLKVGKREQKPLAYHGDITTIDWGYFYLSGFGTDVQTEVVTSEIDGNTRNTLVLSKKFTTESSWLCALSYDEVYAIEYYFEKVPCYWRHEANTMEELLDKAYSQYDEIMARCEKFAEKLKNDAFAVGGENYTDLITLAYRQTIGAHTLCENSKGELLFISRECGSGAHAATADVSYPSMPLFLLYNPELVNAMMRPIFHYAKTKEWSNLYKFAPHDAGFFPIVNGQTYCEGRGLAPESQMPVEECGNMLVMTAATAMVNNDYSLAKENLKLLEQWCEYLVLFGRDPGEQLCTDDFAGHLARNCNLAIKSITGIASYAMICEKLGDAITAEKYMNVAREYAEWWINEARTSDGTFLLAFGSHDTFSMKYNLIWDRLFKTNLFPTEVFEKELESYLSRRQVKYGMPLDNRSDYAKSDWLVWSASLFEDKASFEKMIEPLWNFYNETDVRYAMTDLYKARTGQVMTFRNRTVQGGLFIRILQEKIKQLSF